MGLPIGKLLLLSQLAFLLVASSVELPPAAAPSYHHHFKHHHHTYPHPPAPAHSYPSVKPPVKPPTKPPVYPPVKPPAHPPIKPPTKPPVHPPVKPPVHPPVKAPIYPPVKPPAHPPVKPPTKPPVYPPVKPPAHPPVKPPPVKPPTPYHPPPMSPLVVQGVVYCKNCSYVGIDTLLAAKPLPGATVVLKCKNKKPETVKTDKNGYFFLKASKSISSYNAAKYCRVYLLAAPLGASCTHRTNLNGGIKGGLLKPQETFAPLPYSLFTVGPFAFEPPKRHCHY